MYFKVWALNFLKIIEKKNDLWPLFKNLPLNSSDLRKILKNQRIKQKSLKTKLK